jgi:hypothetical protein
MKKFLCILLSIFVFSTAFCQNQPSGTVLRDEYDAGRRVISDIVVKHDLQGVIEGHAYAGYFFGNYWLVIVDQGASFRVISGLQDSDNLKTAYYEPTNKALSSFFSDNLFW